MVDECMEKKTRRTHGVSGAVYLLYVRDKAVGTAFAIDETHVLTARHNIFDDNEIHKADEIVAIVEASASTNGYFLPMISLEIIACPDPIFNDEEQQYDSISNDNDWIILKRVGDGKFHSVLAIQPSTDHSIASRRPWITIYHFPISFQKAEKSGRHNLASSENRLIGAENFELKCNDLSLISKGSCGGPYVDNISKTALGFHIAGASSYEGKGNKQLVDAINNVPVGLQFHPMSSLVIALKNLRILV